MDELTYAILTQLNPKFGVSAELQSKAKDYCAKVIQEHYSDYMYFFTLLQGASDIYVKFWSIGALEEIINNYYNKYDAGSRHQLHECFLSILEKEPGTVLCSPYIESKYANLFCLILREDYPESWTDAFTRLFSLLQLQVCATTPPVKIKYISFILSCLLAFNREIVDFYEVKKIEEHKKGMKIKDEIRNNVINDIAFLIQQVVENNEFFSANNSLYIVAQSLEVLEKTVD